MGVVPELEVPDPLPRPRQELPVLDGHRDAGADEGRLDMGRHVVVTLGVVVVQMTSPRHQPLQRRAHVRLHV